MNKLLTEFTGGFPFLLNDLRFTDDAIRLAIKDIVNALCGDGPVILAGCQFTQQPTYISVEEGAIFWQGEIWHVYPHNFTAPNPVLEPPYWNFVTGNGPEGSRTFENAETHQVHQIRKAVGSYLPIEGALGNIQWDSAPRFENAGKSQANITLAAGCSNRQERTTLSTVINRGGMITIDAGIKMDALTNNGMHSVGALPAGFRPANPVELPVIAINSGGNTLPIYNTAFLKIGTDGAISIWRTDGDNQTIYNARFDIHVSFPI